MCCFTILVPAFVLLHQEDTIFNFLNFLFRYEDHFVVATFDSAPTVDSEIYRKLTAADRDEYEQKVRIH